MADDIGAAIRAALLAETTVTDLVGKRITEPPLKKSSALPAITVLVDEDDTYNHMTGKTGNAEAILEIECFGKTQAEANSVGRAVRIFLDRMDVTTSAGVIIDHVFADRREEDYDPPAIDGKGIGRFIDRRDYLTFYIDEAV